MRRVIVVGFLLLRHTALCILLHFTLLFCHLTLVFFFFFPASLNLYLYLYFIFEPSRRLT